MIAWDTVTTWRRDGSSWARSVFTGVRVEEAAGASQGAVGPSGASSLKVWFFRDPGLRPGDYVAVGAVDGAEPPDGARLVESVAPWTSRYSHHHTEVTCS